MSGGNPGLKPWEMLQALDTFEEHGNISKAAKALDLHQSTFKNRLLRAQQAGRHTLEAACAGSADNIEDLSHWWKIAKDDEGNGYSLFFKNPINGESADLSQMVARSIENALAEKKPKFPARKSKTTGEHLLVIDLADVHFLKLCVESETGYHYDREVAIHRVVEGTKALLKNAKVFGVHRILFVLGNDILHVDGARSTTTGGTFQDSDGTIFQGFDDARAALRYAIEECALVADVDLVHCMSNHDWVSGWALSQTLAGIFESHPHVHSTPYMLSEMHRKYYRFGSNLIGVSHGDGAKEEKLTALTVKEARAHISECNHIYWLLHHVHHKDRKRRGVDVFLAEKDHVGMTVINTGSFSPEGTQLHIEYVRSPSPPDGWHDRNAFVNRQGVECFLFHPQDGQKVRLTEWF